jgi:hypothetical protein
MNAPLNISYYQGQIDATQFGVVASYLACPRSSIAHLLHVKDPGMLPRLAAQLDAVMRPGPAPADRVRDTIVPLLQDGSLKVSTREPFEQPVPAALVDAGRVPRTAPCQVIYLPPFYLVHTPGLFEGTLHAQKSPRSLPQQRERQAESHAHEPSRKQTKDYGMGH